MCSDLINFNGICDLNNLWGFRIEVWWIIMEKDPTWKRTREWRRPWPMERDKLPLFDIVRDHDFRTKIITLVSQKALHYTGFGFVDDMDLIQTI